MPNRFLIAFMSYLLASVLLLTGCDAVDGPDEFFIPSNAFRMLDTWIDNPGHLSLSVIPNEPLTVFVGQSLSWQIQTSAKAYLWLYAVNEDGTFERLFPNAFEPDNYQTHTQVFTLPHQQSLWQVCVKLTPGEVKMVVVFSEDKQDLLPILLTVRTPAEQLLADNPHWIMRSFAYNIVARPEALSESDC